MIPYQHSPIPEMGEWEKVFKIINLENYQLILEDTNKLENIGIYQKSIEKLFTRLEIY